MRIETARVFEPLLKPSRYKGLWGGRGGGKSHFLAEAVVEYCLLHPGALVVCIREVQKTLQQSAKRLIESKIQSMGVGSMFRILHDRIETPGGGLIIFQGMQDQNAESIKSLEGFQIAWVEEAQSFSHRSLALLRPTMRAEGSEIWFSWNPRRKSDAVDEFLRAQKPDNAAVVKANWRDNPWLPTALEEERLLDLQRYPDRYDHTWMGGYARAFEGSYYAQCLAQAQEEGRIGVVTADPLASTRLFFDIGGAGAKADAMAIWVVQFAGDRILVLDYLEGQGQVLAYYVNELRARGHQGATIYLPHDGVNANIVTGKRLSDHIEDAGFSVTTVPNMGVGAAMMRIEAVRRLFSKVWFAEATTEAGRDALGYYHAQKDERRDIDLGPSHDWSSHAADAFGLMAVCYEEPGAMRRFNRKIEYPRLNYV
jgi:phage terminase large subunit